jgi:hypothetical protein
MKSIREFFGRTITRMGNWFRSRRMLRWLSEQDNVIWVSAIDRPAAAPKQDFPSLKEYRGLRAVFETHANAVTKWHFVWNIADSATQHETDLVSRFGNPGGSIDRYGIRSVELPKPAWKGITPLIIAVAAIVTSSAAILTHLDEITAAITKWKHKPEMTLGNSDTVHVSSNLEEYKKVTLYGDPFFRARLVDLFMQIEPDPDSPETKPLPRARVEMPSARSVDVGNELVLNLPFNKVPPGHYLVKLHGRIETEHREAEFAPATPLHLDARAPYSGIKGRIQPWPPDGADAAGKFKEALVEIRLLFGRPSQPSLNLRVSLDGLWTKWTIVDPLPGGVLERLSQNSVGKPKTLVFALRNFPAAPFSTQVVRLRVEGLNPLSKEDWPNKVGELYVGLLD